jgi:hypothetical protein
MALSFAYFVLVQMMPRIMNYLIVGLALVALCILIVKTFSFNTK